MRKINLLAILLISAYTIYGQSQRLVLHEEFTQTNCGPCAAANPTFHTWLTQHPDVFTEIFYHVWWPGANNDPMYLANVPDNTNRTNYYGVASIGVPYAVIDGSYWKGIGGTLQWSTITNRQAMPSPFDLTLMHRISPGHDSIYLTMLAKASEVLTGPMVAHNVVIEKHIHYTTQPGTNGEKDFYNVMKKMLPSNTGTSLPNAWSIGDYILIETAWAFANVYDYNEIAGVSFIQNTSTKEVYQAANSTTTAMVMPYNTDLQVMKVSNLPTNSCSGRINPVVQVRNNSNNTVTAFHLKYRVNDGSLVDYTWSGSLATLQKTSITLPQYSFSPETMNTLKVFSTDPNNLTDEYGKNDTLNISLPLAPTTSRTLYLILRTDNNPEETTWDVRNSAGDIVQIGGPYAQPGVMTRDTIYLPYADCFTFTIYDAGGNGICCANGPGVFILADSANSSTGIVQGGDFGSYMSTEFNVDAQVVVSNLSNNGSFTVFPNPFSNLTTVSFSMKEEGNVSFSLYDAFGQVVKTGNHGILPTGQQKFDISGNGLATGIYFLKIKAGSQVLTGKVSVVK
jgi:hypothetical protein